MNTRVCWLMCMLLDCIGGHYTPSPTTPNLAAFRKVSPETVAGHWSAKVVATLLSMHFSTAVILGMNSHACILLVCFYFVLF